MVVIVIDQGSLFRSGSKEKIRKGVTEKDLIECVISLTKKLFYNTGSPASKNSPKQGHRGEQKE
ncbi:MAG: N-6 DNA methylase [Thermoplasmata archaeon]